MTNAILEKITALMAKATDPAATEAEAESAMALAMRLMAKNMIDNKTLSEFQKESDDKYLQKTINLKRKNRPETIRYGLAVFVARFTTTKVFTSKNKSGEILLNIFGDKKDVEIFEYIFTICANAAETEFAEFMRRNKPAKHGRALRPGFMSGMFNRLNERMVAMRDDMVRMITAETGTALVVVKEADVLAAFEQRFNVSQAKSTKYKKDADAYRAGRASAEGVNFNKGITAD